MAKLPTTQATAWINSLSDKEAEALKYDWDFWARDNQLTPPGDWSTWLVLAGRGFGKTRMGAEFVRAGVLSGARRIALVAQTAADARDVMVEGESGLLAVSWDKDRDHAGKVIGKPVYEPSKRRLTWPNGAIATTYSGDSPDQLRGPQSDLFWCDELAKFQYPVETWSNLEMGLRLGNNPRGIVTTTPRPIPIIRQLIKAESTHTTRGVTFDNLSNLAPSFRRTIASYEGTRLGRQELLGEVLDDVPGAMWTRDMLEEALYRSDIPSLKRVVVAIDPSGTGGDGDDADSVGIVVAGKGVDGLAYVLADRTCDLSPAGWGRVAVDAYREFKADRIVAERNYGGAMVKHVILTTDRNVAYKEVTASRGKSVRAEPIAALYEQKRVRHVKVFPELEDQMVMMTAGGYMGDTSPDRLDALVWALTELMLEPENVVKVSELRL